MVDVGVQVVAVVDFDAGVLVDVVRGGIRDVLVAGGLFVVPGEAHAGAGGDVEFELGAQDAGGAGRGGVLGPLVGGPLLGDDELEDEVVGDLEAVGGLDVVLGPRGAVDAGHQLALEHAVVEVGLPAGLELRPADVALVLVLDALALAADLGGVLGARRADHLLELLDAPGQFAQTPAGVGVVVPGHDAGHATQDGEIADGVDLAGEGDVQGEVGGGEDAHALLVAAGGQGAGDDHLAAELGFLAGAGAGADVQGVVDAAELAVGGAGEMTGDEVGEGQLLHAGGDVEGFGFGEELPLVEVVDGVGAFATPIGDGASDGGGGLEVHDDAVHDEVGGDGGDLQAAGDEGAGGLLGRVDEEGGRGFHEQIEGDGFGLEGRAGRSIFGGAITGEIGVVGAGAILLVVGAMSFAQGQGGTLEDVHGGVGGGGEGGRGADLVGGGVVDVFVSQ
nr:hypothetical protein CFP56_66493 [Quercus suber]